MTPQNPDLSLNQQGKDVALLQSRLMTLGYTIATSEILNEVFGQSTFQAVMLFQRREGLPPTGSVDAATAQALIKKFEAERTTMPFGPVQSAPNQTPAQSDAGAPGAPITPGAASAAKLHAPARESGEPVEALHISTPAPTSGTPTPSSHQRQPDTPTFPPPAGGEPPPPSGAAPAPPAGMPSNEHHVQGNLRFDYGLPASSITVRLYKAGFAGQDTRLGETRSDGQGNYALSYELPHGQTPNLQVRVVDSEQHEVPISSTIFQAPVQHVLNLVVPGSIQPLAPEFQRLATDLDKTIDGIGRLDQAQENGSRQDLSLLSQTTGWDARLLALASGAATLTQTTGLGQDVLYALLRAGLPSDPQRLALLSPTVIQKALGKANQSSIVSLTDQQITAAVATFKSFADKTRLTLSAPGTNSTFGELLGASGLNADQQSAFADLFFSQASDSDGFWQKITGLNFPAETVNALKLQGKLTYLTLNNAKLAQQLQKDIGSLENLSQLAEKDFYTDTTWNTYLTTLAGPNNTQALDALIPPAYLGATTTDRLAAYAADLARKVRLSFPTQVVGRMVAKGDLAVDNAANVTAFLKNAAPFGFQLGRTPLNAFLTQNQASLFQGVATTDVAATTESIKTLHRLYQITPSNDSLQAALKLGLTSAHDLATLDAQDFIERFGAAFPSTNEAMLVYQKAQQVNATILHLSAAAKQLDTSPTIYALSPDASVREAAKAAISAQFPTMQSLFGSLDFCDCEDCRSVLSPAAYLVDLLHFIDPSDTDANWNQFLTNWANTHNKKNYTDTYLKPYDALVVRRPDLPNLPLTCENTNTVLPYIDVVNEIFEYYIVHGALDASAAYDTGEAASADLLAEPQNILPQAYTILNSAQYPLGLPFDLWIETVRRFLGYFKTPLWRLLDVFKAADPLELFTDANKYPYYRAGILAEYLGISPAEYALFTNTDPLANWFTLYGYTDENTALKDTELKSAKTLSQKLGVSYQDIVDLVKTGLLNPQLQNLIIAQKLGIQPDDLFSYEGMSGSTPMTPAQKTAFEANLDKLTQKYNPTNTPNGFNARNWLSTTWNKGGFNHILLFEDPDAGCNFDQTTLKYADGSAATTSFFLTLNLFVRLWKKLGWTLEETDRALQVFLAPHLPPDGDASFGADYAAAMKTALVYLAHLQALYQELQPGPTGRIKLLTFWSNLPITGTTSLYAQLFLNVSSVNYDPVFDDPTGNYLSGSLLIKDHLSALQGALNLTSDDVELILSDAGIDVNTAPLSLANVSLLYHTSLLARTLNLTVPDFLDLNALSGLNPFAPLSAQPLTVLGDDVMWTQTIEFVQEARKVKGSGFAIADLQYLLRQQFDLVGKYRADPAALMQLVRSLANTIHQIQASNAVPTDPLTFTDPVIAQKLALAFPADVVQPFMGMWTGTIKYTAVVPSASPLDPTSLTQFPAIQVFYDKVKQTQQLTYQGVLLTSQIGPIEQANTSSALAQLLTAVQEQAQTFFQHYFQLATIGQETTGFLPASDFDLLFAPIPANATDTQKQQQISQKRAELAKTFLPYLQQKLIRQAIIQAMVADLSADASLTATLTTNTNLLADPTQPTKTLLDAFTGVAANGLNVAYFASTDGTGAPLATGTVATADTTDALTPKPAGTQSAHFEGALEVAADGPYRFFAELDKQNAQVTLQFDAKSDPLILAVAPSDKAEVSNVIELKAGIPYHFTLDFHTLGGGDASLLVQGESLPQGALNQLTLYAQAAVDRFTRALVLLKKTLQLIQGFSLTEREVTYLLTHSADFNNLSFSALPTQSSDDSPAKAATLFGQFLRLAAYTSLKQGPAGGSDGLIDVFEQAQQTFLATANPTQSAQATLQGLYQTVANLTRRKTSVVQVTAQQLGSSAQSHVVGGQLLVKASGFTQEQGVQRLWDALQVVQTVGISANTLAGTTGIIDSTKTQDARAALADHLKNAVRAYYTVDAWRPIAQSIFDKLRQAKRDAVSAYLVNKLAKENTGQLFEYFLVDPGMEPVVQTSRLRLALSSVQTFIQLCLLNLEPTVDPSAIPANQWEWMKRYRVWQANREIFLWPENWMEPEWRPDKTDLFQGLESALLQGDVTNDLVEDAFFTYLKDLDDRARLDIVTMCLEEATNDPAANILHVIGRNYNKPQKYFYRRFAYGAWTAWEPLQVDIDGDHLALVKWRDRLHLFWVTFSHMGRMSSSTGGMTMADAAQQPISSTGPQKQKQLQLNWSEYFQGKWSARKSSDLSRAPAIDVDDDFDPLSSYLHVAKETDGTSEGAVKIVLDGPIKRAFRLVGKNSEPTLRAADYERPQAYGYSYTHEGQDATKTDGAGAFRVDFPAETKIQNGQIIDLKVSTEAILQQGNEFAILVCDTPALPMSTQTDLKGVLAAYVKALGLPFFYQDLENGITMFVQPSHTETITSWGGYVIPLTAPDPSLVSDTRWSSIALQSQTPSIQVNLGDPAPVAVYQVQARPDWVTNSATAIAFGTSLIGQSGALKSQQTLGALVSAQPLEQN